MARLFNDASSQVLSTDSAAVTAAPLTMACWFNSDDITVLQVMMYIGDKDVNNLQFFYLAAAGATANDPVRFAAANGSAITNLHTTTGYTANTWYHACGVANSATSRDVYINGGSTANNTTSRVPSGIDRTSIGAGNDSTPANYMSGMIAEAAIWNTNLTAAEVALLAKGVSPFFVRPASLVNYWPLIGRYSPEIDIVGGTNLTVTGATAAAHPRIFYINPSQYIPAVSGDITVISTGIQGTGQVGTVTTLFDYIFGTTGIQGTGQIGTASTLFDYIFGVTGLQGTGEIGSPTTTTEAIISATGLEGVGQLGSVNLIFDYIFGVTGVQGTGQIGTPTTLFDYIFGVTGAQGTGQIGSPTVITEAIISATGLEGVGQLGSVNLIFDYIFGVVGIQGTGQIGTPTTQFDYIFGITGIQGTGQIGTTTISSDMIFGTTGLEGTGQIGTVSTAFDYIFNVTGVQGTGQIGDVIAGTFTTVSVLGIEGLGQLGSPTINYDFTLQVTGMQGVGEIGVVTAGFSGDVIFEIVGLQASAYLNTVVCWTPVVTRVAPPEIWTEIDTD